jgi:hypothetical protein
MRDIWVLQFGLWVKAYWAGVLAPGFDWLGTHVHGLLMVLGLGLNWCKWSFVGVLSVMAGLRTDR